MPANLSQNFPHTSDIKHGFLEAKSSRRHQDTLLRLYAEVRPFSGGGLASRSRNWRVSSYNARHQSDTAKYFTRRDLNSRTWSPRVSMGFLAYVLEKILFTSNPMSSFKSWFELIYNMVRVSSVRAPEILDISAHVVLRLTFRQHLSYPSGHSFCACQ